MLEHGLWNQTAWLWIQVLPLYWLCGLGKVTEPLCALASWIYKMRSWECVCLLGLLWGLDLESDSLGSNSGSITAEWPKDRCLLSLSFSVWTCKIEAKIPCSLGCCGTKGANTYRTPEDQLRSIPSLSPSPLAHQIEEFFNASVMRDRL